MDWAEAIERNRNALRTIVAALFGMLELTGGIAPRFLPPGLHRAVLRVLCPAESAMRRLVVLAARGVVAKLKPSGSRPFPPIGRTGSGRLAFRLFDPREVRASSVRGNGNGARTMPRVHVFAADPRVAMMHPTPRPAARMPPPPAGSVDATRLCRRLEAIKLALEDLPRQARRLARWRLRRQGRPGPKSASPLRFGRPPGYRRRPVHPVDDVLAECHDLVRIALASDTS